MNKKSQFFIISTVVMAITIASLLTILSVPYQLTITNLLTQSRGLDSLSEIQSNLKIIGNTLYDEWPGEQSHRTSFEINNVDIETIENDAIVIRVPITNYAEMSSFELRDEEGEKINAVFSSVENGTVTISFSDSIEKERKYYVYYNVQSDDETVLVEQSSRTRISETGTTFTYETPYYEVMFSKTTGAITYLSVKGHNIDLATNFYARARTTSDYDQTSMTAEFTQESFFNNMVYINISGQLSPEIYLTQHYFLHPEAIVLYQDFQINSSGTYNLSYVMDSTTQLDSLIYSNYINISLSQPTETMFENTNWHGVFQDNKGITVIYDDKSLSTVQTTSGVDSRVQLLDDSYSIGTATQAITLIPYYGNYTLPRTISNAYLNGPKFVSSSTRTEYSVYVSQPLIDSLLGASDVLLFNINNEESSKMVFKNNYYSSIPTVGKYISTSSTDYNTLNITDENGITVPATITTKNYHNSSYLGFYATNNNSVGVTSTYFNVLNLNGDDFAITVNMNSNEVTDTLIAKVYSPNSTEIVSTTLTPVSPGSYENQIINVPGFNVSGTYILNLTGENVTFTISSNTPLLSIYSPFILNNTIVNQLYFEAGEDFYLNCLGVNGTSADVILNNSVKEIFSDTTSFTQDVNHSYSSTTGYNLFVEPGTTLINSTQFFGTKDYYLDNDYSVNILIYDSFIGKNTYSADYEQSNTNLFTPYSNMSFDFAVNELYNKDYEWYLDTEVFYYKNSVDWLYNGDFYACIGTYGSCSTETTIFTFDSLIENSSLSKTALYTSNSIDILLTYYNASNLFKIQLINPTEDTVTFGINYRIENDDDTYYYASFLSSESALGASEISYSSSNVSNTWSFVGKRDDSAYSAMFVNLVDLKQGEDALIIDDDYLRIGVNSFGTKTLYFYVGDSWDEIEHIQSDLNNIPEAHNNLITYYYTYTSDTVQSQGTLIG